MFVSMVQLKSSNSLLLGYPSFTLIMEVYRPSNATQVTNWLLFRDFLSQQVELVPGCGLNSRQYRSFRDFCAILMPNAAKVKVFRQLDLISWRLSERSFTIRYMRAVWILSTVGRLRFLRGECKDFLFSGEVFIRRSVGFPSRCEFCVVH